MTRVKINVGAVNLVGEKLKENANDVKRLKMIINDIVNDMSSAWEGTDYDALREKVTERLLPSVEKSSKVIDGLGSYLKKVPGGYQSLDNVFKVKKITD